MQSSPDTITEVRHQLHDVMTTSLEGSVVETLGMTATVADFPAPVGAQVSIERDSGPAARQAASMFLRYNRYSPVSSAIFAVISSCSADTSS